MDKMEDQAKLTLESYENSDYKGPLETFLGVLLEQGRTGDRPEKIAKCVSSDFASEVGNLPLQCM